MSEFAGRMAVIATMHRKEQAIAPLLESAFDLKTLVPQNFDTNVFGTFTRDVDRPADQRTTARIKAEAALDLTGETLAIASEGSFGPHPNIPLLPCDRELVLLLDRQHDLEIVGEVLSTETNYRSRTIRSFAEALTFSEAVGFPKHGLVVMPAASGQPTDRITKGIVTEAALKSAVEAALRQSDAGTLHIETDMRALYNPTRMAAIAEATQALLDAIARRCPQCDCPGFSEVQRFPGLPCSLCKTPTLLTLSLLYECQRCQFQHKELFPDGEQAADPALCPYCNP